MSSGYPEPPGVPVAANVSLLPCWARLRSMDTLIIKITGMKDAECVRAVANAIQDLPHIGHIEISLERGEASVDHGRLIGADDIQRAIEDAGYAAEI
jgi:copper chaperone